MSSALDHETISKGEKYDLESNLVPDSYTLFYFSTPWCPFCQMLDKSLDESLAGRTDVAIRRIDTVNWESDAAKQASREFGLEDVPYVRVHAPDGTYIGHVTGNDITRIVKLLTKRATGPRTSAD